MFAKGGGLLYLTGPTAGYLYGMTIAAWFIGYLAEKNFNESYRQFYENKISLRLILIMIMSNISYCFVFF